MNIDISMVVCTKNRSRKLERCLQKINDVDNKDIITELIIVDNGSTDDTQKIISKFTQKSKIKLTAVIEKKPGLGNARNKGISIARGYIIAFIDDDCYLEKNYLRSVKSKFEDMNIGFVGGKVLLYDKSDIDFTTQYSNEKREFNKLQLIHPGSIMGANLCFRKEALISVNCFDPLLGTGTKFIADDIDCAYRIIAKGWKGLYDPELVVYHHHGRKNEDEIKELNKYYSKGLGAYLFKSYFNPLFKLKTNLTIIKFFVFRGHDRVQLVKGIIEYICTYLTKNLSTLLSYRGNLFSKLIDE